MIKKIRLRLALLLTVGSLLLAAPLAFAGTAVAAAAGCPSGDSGTPPNCTLPSGSSNVQNDLSCGATFSLSPSSDCGSTTTTGAGKVQGVVTTMLDYFSVIVGLLAVVMLIFAGLKFITAGGDSSKVQSARQSIVYAVIGLVVVALAQVIVQFVLSRANPNNATSGSSSGTSIPAN